MDEKLRVDVLESTEKKPDISYIPNSMFDQNTASFFRSETMNRDYLYHIYGESMDFLNKEVRLTRTKHYEMREKIEKGFAESIRYEKKKMVIVTAIFLVLVIFAIVSFGLSADSFDKYEEIHKLSFNEFVDRKYVRAYWAMGGLFFGVGWIALVTGVTGYGVIVFNAIKNIKQYKKKKERALEKLEESKREQMLLGRYDASK
ncbi:MAG: hypothetical protein IJN49_08130 [Clostridia bacterium]|nr:hypothetical protein [Clostridia bacterium]